MIFNRHIVYSLFVSLFFSSIALADDWTQWRGPGRTDRSSETGLLQRWPSDGPRQLWTSNRAGMGYSGFAISAGKLFTMGDDGDHVFVICMDAGSGEKLWQQNVGRHFDNDWGDGPRGTPTWDNDRLYVLAPAGELVCLDASDGKTKWSKKMQDFGGKIPKWGYAESPLLLGEALFCTPGGNQGAIVALEKSTGEIMWQSAEVKSPAHYSSMIAVDLNGRKQLIHLLVDKVVGVDSEDGGLLWSWEWLGRTAIIPTPIYKDGLVYVTSGYGIGCSGLKILENNVVQEVYHNKVMKNHHGGVVELDGHVYGFSD
ncbi:MAG: PQQ-binding-like beta-propeller repeat protein, partial [Planctomycetota bacterium]